MENRSGIYGVAVGHSALALNTTANNNVTVATNTTSTTGEFNVQGRDALEY